MSMAKPKCRMLIRVARCVQGDNPPGQTAGLTKYQLPIVSRLDIFGGIAERGELYARRGHAAVKGISLNDPETLVVPAVTASFARILNDARTETIFYVCAQATADVHDLYDVAFTRRRPQVPLLAGASIPWQVVQA